MPNINLLADPEFLSCNQYPNDSFSLLETARKSILESSSVKTLVSKSLHQNQYPNDSFSLLETARKSILQSSSVKTLVSKSLHQKHSDFWNSNLDHLQVQSKFKGIAALEPNSCVWNRLLSGLPAGQLSFLLCAAWYRLPPNRGDTPGGTTLYTYSAVLSLLSYRRFPPSSSYMQTFLALEPVIHLQQPFQLTSPHLLLNQTWC